MTAEDGVAIQASPEVVYRLASVTENWPKILPHYRSVVILDGDDRKRTVAMACNRPFGPILFPCRWRAEQTNHPDTHRIEFVHLAGPAKGMWVQWSIDSDDNGGCVAVIEHRFDVKFPILGRIYAERVVMSLFVRAVAGRTLARIKVLAEAT